MLRTSILCLLIASSALAQDRGLMISSENTSATTEISASTARDKRELPVVKADAAAFIQKRAGMTAVLRRAIDAVRSELVKRAASLNSDHERAALLGMTDRQLAAVILASNN